VSTSGSSGRDDHGSRGATTRDQVLKTTRDLLAEHGTTGTGLNQIVAASGVSYGSVYHHFAGGKDELIAAAIGFAGDELSIGLVAVLDGSPTLDGAVSTFFAIGAAMLESSGFHRGCPIGTAIADGHDSEPIREAASAVFTTWHVTISDRAVHLGASQQVADQFASAVVALYEGALLVARAAQSTEPMLAASCAASELARAAVS
jgi:TetR/AcrR family transcriptional regulator, lmrAB and yxaGH operons repressor